MTAGVDEIRRLVGSFEGEHTNLPPFDEIYPGRQAPVLRKQGGRLTLDVMTWGFPGPAAAGGRPATNVRHLDSPFWRPALANLAWRCIVPVTQFCEWTVEPDPATGRKRKVWFGMREQAQPLFAFAGIWRPNDGERFMAFLTCEPNATVGALHPKAMPVMLDPVDFPRWLESDRVHACELAKPFADSRMRVLADWPPHE